MQRAEATATIPATPDQVFAFLADPANLPAWQTGILSAERTSDGPLGVGATARVVRALMGQRITADLRLTAYAPSERLVLESEVSGIGAEATLELSAADGGTQLRFAMTFAARNPFMAPLEGMAAGAARSDVESSLARLQAHFATEAGAGPG